MNAFKILDFVDEGFISRVLCSSIEMAKSSKVTMVWEDTPDNILEKFLNRGKRNIYSDEFKKFNYPRAFLLLGIVNYVIKENDKNKLDDFKTLFNDYITPQGKPSFHLNRVDQTPFGEVALKLYAIYNDEKYLIFAEEIYKYLKENVDAIDGVIDYRTNIKVVLNDMIGLVVPFLLLYSDIAKQPNAKILAEHQMEYFLVNGSDNQTFIPAHGIDKNTKAKLGSANWGRGIGWYFLGLSSCAKNNPRFLTPAVELQKSLQHLRNKNKLWSQFPGSSENFDASSTLMILYSFINNNPNFVTKEELLHLLRPYFSEKGVILQTSGDTVGLNEYSKTFGPSELSQGFLLLILSKL